MTRSDDDEFDRRLSLEIIPDAYGPEEQALSWYYYLEEHLQFPFEAECVSDRSTSPLRIGDKVGVVGMPTEEDCEHEMLVNIRWSERVLAIPLLNLVELMLMLRHSRRCRIGVLGSIAVMSCKRGVSGTINVH
jgi:Calcium binding